MRVFIIGVTTLVVGLLVYIGCVVWPLNLLRQTALIAAIGGGMGWALVSAVYLDSRSSGKNGEKG